MRSSLSVDSGENNPVHGNIGQIHLACRLIFAAVAELQADEILEAFAVCKASGQDTLQF